MTDSILIPLQSIGVLALTRGELDTALAAGAALLTTSAVIRLKHKRHCSVRSRRLKSWVFPVGGSKIRPGPGSCLTTRWVGFCAFA
jgi:hypothetical protein